MAAHWFIPVPVIKKIWWFSPTFFHYWEDDNYINRMKYHWYKIYVAPKLNVVHDRYFRKDSNDKKIHLWYVYCLNLLSNPFEKWSKIYFRILVTCIYNMIIYKSWKPLTCLFRIFKDYNTIKNNKINSINWTHPFIE